MLWILSPRPLAVATAVAVVTAVAVAAVITLVVSLAALVPGYRSVLPLRYSVPPGKEFAQLNRVSHWPKEWAEAVCVPPLYPVRTPYADLPNASAIGVCKARIEPGGDSESVTIARFSAELPMQVDLYNAGYEWYAFAYHQGGMTVFATYSDAVVSDSATNLTESPVLEPLKRFGFHVYGSPGP